MFIKTNNKNRWINLSTCRSVETHQLDPSHPWRIVLSSAVILSDTEKQFVGQFETETEAEEAINAMWQAYRDGEKVWEVEAFNTISPMYLTIEKARQLILKRFAGQPRVPTRQIIDHVEAAHCESIRELSKNEKQIVQDALSSLRGRRLADNPERGYWSFKPV